MESKVCPAVAVIGRMESQKLAACYYCAAPATVFWAIFQRLRPSSVEIVGLGLLWVLTSARWNCHCGQRQPRLVRWRAQRWSLFFTFLLRCSYRSFSGYLSITAGFSGGPRLIEGCSSYNLFIYTWSIMVLVDQWQAPKSTSFTCFLL